MYANLAEFLQDLLGEDHSARNIVELLARDSLLSSPLRTGFTDRQVRVALIDMLGRLGDVSALPTLETHARLPPVMGGEVVADAAKRAIAAIRGERQEAPATPLAERMFEQSLHRVTDALNAVMVGPKAPSELEAAGLRGRNLQRALFALDEEEPLPAAGSGGFSQAAARVVQVLREIDCDDDIRGEVDRLFTDPADVDRWFDVASLLRQNGCFHGSLEAYDQAVGRFSTEIDSMWWSNRGWLLQLWERYGDAIASFRRALELNPTYERPRIGLQDVQRLLDSLDSDGASIGESRGVDAERTPQPYESRRLHRMAGKGGQQRTRAFALLSPANLAIEESESDGASFDAIAHRRLNRGSPPEAARHRDEDVYFISYRWESEPHRQWVFKFAKDLERHGYRVIYDQFESLDLRDRIGPVLRTDRMKDEIPRLVEDLGRATVFVPILTEGYRRCVEPRRTGNPAAGVEHLSWSLRANANDGWVFDEWQVALRLRLRDGLRWQAVWRSGPVVPYPFSRHRVADFRDDDRYAAMLDTHFPHRGTASIGDR
ncbi:hypothetical protein BURC_02865 [Burkholderiaceae bacterium]|nr:hypothetical protein BURC_02865 [Burkholderiaceae bacterium]